MSVYEKLMNVQSELHIPKGNFNSFGRYNYRSLEDIFEGRKPVLEKYKCAITVVDKVIEISGRFYIEATATFIDVETGEKVSNTALAREDDAKKGMDSAQLTGATSSYSRKYALGGLLMLDDCKDADTPENAEEQKNRASRDKKHIDAPKAPQGVTEADKTELRDLVEGLKEKYPTKNFSFEAFFPNGVDGFTVREFAEAKAKLMGLLNKAAKNG